MESPAAAVSILVLDASGTPRRWIGIEDAAGYYYKEQVVWDLGRHAFTLHGGTSRATGLRSILTLRSIVAVRGDASRRPRYDQVPALTREMLFARDRYVCAYCVGRFRPRELTCEAVKPPSRGGRATWTTLRGACAPRPLPH